MQKACQAAEAQKSETNQRPRFPLNGDNCRGAQETASSAGMLTLERAKYRPVRFPLPEIASPGIQPI
jgi:hypothetical protein